MHIWYMYYTLLGWDVMAVAECCLPNAFSENCHMHIGRVWTLHGHQWQLTVINFQTISSCRYVRRGTAMVDNSTQSTIFKTAQKRYRINAFCMKLSGQADASLWCFRRIYGTILARHLCVGLPHVCPIVAGCHLVCVVSNINDGGEIAGCAAGDEWATTTAPELIELNVCCGCI